MKSEVIALHVSRTIFLIPLRLLLREWVPKLFFSLFYLYLELS